MTRGLLKLSLSQSCDADLCSSLLSGLEREASFKSVERAAAAVEAPVTMSESLRQDSPKLASAELCLERGRV